MSPKKVNILKAECPGCGSYVNVGPRPKMHQRFSCNTCDADLIVVWLEPVELDYDEEEEEYDYADFEEEEY
jgi:lysine biosynthesis protein LysW